jgi:hypothetical protein
MYALVKIVMTPYPKTTEAVIGDQILIWGSSLAVNLSFQMGSGKAEITYITRPGDLESPAV